MIAALPTFVKAFQDAFEDLLSARRADAPETRRVPTLHFVDVRVEEAHGRHDLVVLFEDATRAGCRFGFRWDDISRWKALVGNAESLARICFANLEEKVEAGDSDYAGHPCSSDEVTWI